MIQTVVKYRTVDAGKIKVFKGLKHLFTKHFNTRSELMSIKIEIKNLTQGLKPAIYWLKKVA